MKEDAKTLKKMKAESLKARACKTELKAIDRALRAINERMKDYEEALHDQESRQAVKYGDNISNIEWALAALNSLIEDFNIKL